MSDASPLLGLPYILPAQAQKHVTHNEAIRTLDALVQLSVADRTRTAPPLEPSEGDRHLVAAGATGAWSAQDGKVALWAADAGWLFLAPRPGWLVWVEDEALLLARGTTGWEPVVSGVAEFDRLGVGTTPSATNRLAVSSPASLFDHAGAGHQLKVNKAAAADTASLLFQTGFSGRAEMGTAGSDDFAVKVSPDGSVWHDVLVADRTSGRMSVPHGLSVSGTLTLPDAGVTRAALADGAALSLIGRSAGSAGPVADIAAASDHQVMRRSGASIGFGAVALGQAAAVSGQLPVANGGTGAATVAAAQANLGLVPTTGPTDTTDGRVAVMRLGGVFGIGATQQPALDVSLDSFDIASGEYRLPNTFSAGGTFPPGLSGTALYLSVRRHVAGSMFQMLWRSNPAQHGGVWIRIGTSSTWGEWRMIYTQARLLDTVSQSGGVPTGGAMSGNASAASPAGGWWQRTADGFQTVHHSLTTSASADTTWTYTQAFLTGSPPAISITPVGDSELRVRLVSRSATACVFSIRDASNDRVAVPVDLIARGRWSNMT